MPCDSNTIFDGQMSPFLEERRFIMNVLLQVHRYLSIKRNKGQAPQAKDHRTPRRVVIISGKASPFNPLQNTLINFIIELQEIINNDADVGDCLKVIYLPNYSVSLAEKIFPALDIYQNLKVPGIESELSTSSMKALVNGALLLSSRAGIS